MRHHARSVAAAMLFTTSAGAQAVAVRGVVYDSLHARPLAGAFVSLAGKTATTDSTGRFTINGVAPGSHFVAAQHDVVDRLGMSAIGSRAVVTDGRDPIHVAVPSFGSLWKQVCGPTPPGADTGFVFGVIRGARAPAKVVVFASWVDLSTNGVTVRQKERTLETRADERGSFTLCGVPAGTGLSIRAEDDSAETGMFVIPSLGAERITRRDLRMATAAAELSGKVQADSGGGPLANAEVSIAGFSAKTNERGEFRFTGLVPGSHQLYVRKVGYAESEVGLDLEGGERRTHTVTLTRGAVKLDSMLVTTTRLARDEQMRLFEEHRKVGLGKFLTVEQLERHRGLKMTAFVYQWPGVYVDPKTRKLYTKRGIMSIRGGTCVIALYLDGVPFWGENIDEVPPETLAGVEYYAGGASTPIEYGGAKNRCGVIIMHSRYKTGK